jgi:hypothetical protein
VTPQSLLPIPQTQVPSAPSSSLCPENAERQRSRWLVRIYFADLRASLACTTTLRRGDQLTEMLYVATLSIGLYFLLEGPVPTRVFYPGQCGINF